jgi:maltooligosyltrehalose trehalohydrolase
VSFPATKLAAALLFAAPALPLLFMGEEYGETSPFQFFTSYLDPALVEAVRRGRAAEFARFGWEGKIPDPSEPATYLRSRLSHPLAGAPRHRELRDYYRQWLNLRRTHPALGAHGKERTQCEVDAGGNVLTLSRLGPAAGIRLVANLSASAQPFAPPPEDWRVLIDSEDKRYAGGGTPRPLAPYQAILYEVGR